MAFIVGGLIIGAGASIAGGAIASSGARSAANTASAASEREIEFNRESRDLARSDQAPYREAGYTALDALMSLTGLGGGGGGAPAVPNRMGPFVNAREMYGEDTPLSGGRPMQRRRSSYGSGIGATQPKYEGGPIQPDTIYNVHEMGNENIYSKGSYTRGNGPSTIDGQTGYVQPNIEGMYQGGMLGGAYGGVFDIYENQAAGDSGPRRLVPPSQRTSPAGQGTTPASPPRTTSVDPATGYPAENPGGVEGGYNFQTDPGYGFRTSEGSRVVERGAAARGGLLSGGTAKALTRYGQDYASNEFTNVYNRISNIAGLGQVSANASGNYAMNAGQSMGTAAAQGGYASAYGQQASGNAWANAANQIGQMDWGSIFNRGNPNGVPR